LEVSWTCFSSRRLRKIPSWTKQDFWAPELHQIADDYFVLYYAVRDKTGILCVGAAYSNNITGPFKDLGKPLIKNSSVGYIDATYFYDRPSNKSYITWKEDGNGLDPPETYTPIWANQLSADGLSLIGDKVSILENDPSSWEGILVEGPWVIYTKGYYYLFYSANMYATPMYALGVARSKSLLGPYVKSNNNPIVHSNDNWSGPGHCSVLSLQNKGQNYFFLYHSWIAGQILDGHPRELLMDFIRWDNNDWPFIATSSPSTGKQPIPGPSLDIPDKTEL